MYWNMGLCGSYMNNTWAICAFECNWYVKKDFQHVQISLQSNSLQLLQFLHGIWAVWAVFKVQTHCDNHNCSAIKTQFEHWLCIALTLYIQGKIILHHHCYAKTMQTQLNGTVTTTHKWSHYLFCTDKNWPIICFNVLGQTLYEYFQWNCFAIWILIDLVFLELYFPFSHFFRLKHVAKKWSIQVGVGHNVDLKDGQIRPQYIWFNI